MYGKLNAVLLLVLLSGMLSAQVQLPCEELGMKTLGMSLLAYQVQGYYLPSAGLSVLLFRDNPYLPGSLPQIVLTALRESRESTLPTPRAFSVMLPEGMKVTGARRLVWGKLRGDTAYLLAKIQDCRSPGRAISFNLGLQLRYDGQNILVSTMTRSACLARFGWVKVVEWRTSAPEPRSSPM